MAQKFEHRIIIDRGDADALDADALKAALETAHVHKAGRQIIATVRNEGWTHHDEELLEELFEQGKIGAYKRQTEPT